VLLAPLRFGAGLKGKLLDAAAHGLPMVTTGMGVEGWDPGVFEGEGGGVLVARDSDEFVRLAADAYCDEALWKRLHAGALRSAQACAAAGAQHQRALRLAVADLRLGVRGQPRGVSLC